MTTLKLTMMLGPRDTIEVCECGMPEMPGVLFAADTIEGWDAAEVERVLLAAGPVFREAIMARKHEAPPPPPRPAPALVRDTWGDPTPAERLAICGPKDGLDGAPPVLSFRVEVARTLAPEAWAEADASLKKADEVLVVLERRRAA